MGETLVHGLVGLVGRTYKAITYIARHSKRSQGRSCGDADDDVAWWCGTVPVLSWLW